MLCTGLLAGAIILVGAVGAVVTGIMAAVAALGIGVGGAWLVRVMRPNRSREIVTRLGDLLAPAFDDSYTMLQSSLRALFEEHSTSEDVRRAEASDAGWAPGLWRLLGESGLLGIGIPEEAGGPGGEPFHAALFAEEAGRHLAPVPVAESSWAATVLAGK